MWEKLKNLGRGIFGTAFFVIIVLLSGLLIGLFIHGGAWLNAKIYPFLVVIFVITFGIALFILTPISIFKKARGFAGNGLVISSFIFGLTLWVWSFLLAYIIWGGLGIFIGLSLFGVGVVPIAMLATLSKGMWTILGQLIFLIILYFGSRFFGVFLTESYNRSKKKRLINNSNAEKTDNDLLNEYEAVPEEMKVQEIPEGAKTYVEFINEYPLTDEILDKNTEEELDKLLNDKYAEYMDEYVAKGIIK